MTNPGEQPPFEQLDNKPSFMVPVGAESNPLHSEQLAAGKLMDDLVDGLFANNPEAVEQRKFGTVEPWSELKLTKLADNGSWQIRAFALSLVDQMSPGRRGHGMPDKGLSLQFVDIQGRERNEYLYNLERGEVIRIDMPDLEDPSDESDEDSFVIVGPKEVEGLVAMLSAPDVVALPPQNPQ